MESAIQASSSSSSSSSSSFEVAPGILGFLDRINL